MLNIITELKKNPNESGFFILTHKARAFIVEKQGFGDLCNSHRVPLRFNVEVVSISDYVNEVQNRARKLASGEVRVRSYEEGKRRILVGSGDAWGGT
jgi:hypothetical protein